MGAPVPSAIQNSYTIFDDRRWPIVVFTLPEIALDEPAFAEHSRRVLAYFERRENFAFVVDARHAPPMAATQRRTLANLLDRCVLEYPNVRNYTAIIVASAVQRGIVKALTWLSRQPGPAEVFASLDEGIAWCSTRLAEGKGEHRGASRRS